MIAHRIYARALFQAAQDKGRLELVHSQVQQLRDAVESVDELRALLSNPEIESSTLRTMCIGFGNKTAAMRRTCIMADGQTSLRAGRTAIPFCANLLRFVPRTRLSSRA